MGIYLVNYFSSDYGTSDISHTFSLITNDDSNIMSVVSKKTSLDSINIAVLHLTIALTKQTSITGVEGTDKMDVCGRQRGR